MKKNIIYTILGIIVALFYLGASIEEISGEQFPIGGTILHDSTTSIFTINKSVYIGGDVRMSGLYFKELNSVITEDLSGLILNSDYFTFQTLHEEPVMLLDSIAGIELLRGSAKFPYLKVGTSSPEFYFREFKYVTGAVNTNTVMLHGITNYRKIISYEASMRDHATGVQVMANAWGGTTLFLARIDSTFLKTYIAAGSTDIANDTVTFLLKIRK